MGAGAGEDGGALTPGAEGADGGRERDREPVPAETSRGVVAAADSELGAGPRSAGPPAMKARRQNDTTPNAMGTTALRSSRNG